MNTGKRPPDVLTALGSLDNQEAAMVVEDGLPASDVEQLADESGLGKELLARKTGVALRTLNRKLKQHARLSPDESARLVRFARVLRQAMIVFRTRTAAVDWMATPDSALSGKAPLDLLSTEFGAREVENLLIGMAHGFVV